MKTYIIKFALWLLAKSTKILLATKAKKKEIADKTLDEIADLIKAGIYEVQKTPDGKGFKLIKTSKTPTDVNDLTTV